MNARAEQPAGVPLELTSFVGRELQLREVATLLDEASLLTMVGPGGVGKTRLAQRLVQALRRVDSGMVLGWATLSVLEHALSSPGSTLVERQIAAQLGVEISTGHALRDLLIDHLRDQTAGAGTRQVGYLLVLDNCEHLTDQLGALVSELLTAVDGLRVVATSREPLGCAGEHTYVVPPLTYPSRAESGANGERYEAVDLLIERAKAAGTVIGQADHAAAAVLCQRLDGIPLAIELAAAALRSQSLPEIVARLTGGPTDARFGLLTGGPRYGAHPMHHSLQAAVDWSYRLCTGPQQLLWARLSIFEDGWDLAAAEMVCASDGIAAADILGLLRDLVEKSIVIADTTGGRTRYRLLETLRQYGHTLAEQRGERETLQRRHRDCYLALARAAAQDWFGPRELDWLYRIRTEMPNMRAALAWSLATADEAASGLDLAVSLARLRLPFFLGISGEAVAWLETGLARTVGTAPASLRTLAMALAGNIALCAGSVPVARRLLELCRTESAAESAAPLVYFEGIFAFFVEGAPRAVALLDRAIDAFDNAGSGFRGERQMALLFKAMAAAWYAPHEEALAVTEACFAETASAGSEWAMAWAVMARGLGAIWHGDPTQAMNTERRQREIGDQWGMMYATHLAAWAATEVVLARRGVDVRRDTADARHIAEVLGGAARMRERYGVEVADLVPFVEADRKCEVLATEILGSAVYDAAFAKGYALSYDDILTLAMDAPAATAVPGDKEQQARVDAWNELTQTEKQIALLVAQGLTDPQIARSRVCSVRTVEKHVEHIRAKLFVVSRAEVARWIPNAESLRGVSQS
ncbi:ATP-binding protein [Nocardia sp. NPDC049149]|uniref:ATP-binding protein n=1 Tax=Nocardia sp. NPDC049149 TaxID=3364315 RepID=UPI00371110EF